MMRPSRSTTTRHQGVKFPRVLTRRSGTENTRVEVTTPCRIGRDEPGEVIEAGNIRLRGEAARLVDVLLPNQHPCLAAPDAF